MKSRLYFVLSWLLVCLRSAGNDSVVVFNELMYNPRDGDSVEWVELFNQMAVDVEISGWEIEGIGYRFPTNTIIGGGKYIVVASDPGDLGRRTHPTNVFGPFTGRLANEGERLRLRNHNFRIMDSMAYDTKYPWPVGPDGSGFALAKRNPNSASDRGENWTQSAEPDGTPGGTNFPSVPSQPGILLNELAAATNQTFWIELINLLPTAVDLTNYELAFSRSPALRVKLGAGTVLEPGGYFLLEPGSYHPLDGEKVFLHAPEKARMLDAIEVKGHSIGRSSEHGNRWLSPAAETPGAPNSFALERDIVINEIMYAPPPGETNGTWIELINKGTNRIDLGGWNISGVGYEFPTNSAIDPGEYIVIAENAQALAAKYPGVRILGDFSGRLSRKSDRLRLEDAVGNPADEVQYFDGSPWPEFADGAGSSLELRDVRADNGKPEAWTASRSPGAWQTYSYSAAASSDGGPTRWNEFIFGLLDAGAVLLDDFSVIENPTTAPREILQNGAFKNGAAFWRFLGTHRNATVIADSDDPSNQVLRLAADGPTEHMHNHVETTFAGNLPIRNGTIYKISFRAKWLAGCNKLNTRLYFNRVARTTTLQQPNLFGTPGERNSVAASNGGPMFEGLRHNPAVPRAIEPVQVTVQASDPDGVKNCRLFWGVNGTNWASLEMVRNGASYGATIPARPAATVIQFYVEAQDSLGIVSFYPAEGPASRALYKVNDSQALAPRLHNVRLVMLPSEANALHANTNVMSNGRSLCTVIYNDAEVFYNCGLHLQASQRGRMDTARVGFTVNFPSDQLFRGIHDTITFDRSGGWSGRGGRQDEIVIRHIINQAGDSPDMYNDLVRVLTPLTAHTGTAMLLMAKYGDEFLDGSVYPKDGSMFKLELIYYPTTSVSNDPQRPKIPQPDDVIGVEIGNLGSGHEPYRWFFPAENHSGDDDYDGLIRVAQAFSLSGSALQQRTSELMDMEQWARVFAFKALSGDADTYGFGLPHNQLIYVPSPGKALALPWDLDFAWSRAATVSINVSGRLGQIIHGIPANQRLYLGNIQDIVSSTYNTNYMARWTAHYGTLAGQNYSGILSYINQRANSARSQLRPPAAFRITTFAGSTFTTNASSMILRGTAPYTFKRLQKNVEPPGTGFTWTAAETWETTIPLNPGVNNVSLVGYNFRNEPAATIQATVISTLDPALSDRDRDGMPDGWESQFGLNPDLPDSASDHDHDGFANLAEFQAGTNPIDATSYLRLSVERTSTQQLNLSFAARAARAYRLQYRVGLQARWTDLLTLPPATEDRFITQPQIISTVAPALFYRLLLEVPSP